MSTEVQTKTIDWETLVRSEEQRPDTELSYQFSNGRTFTEPFLPGGTGVYAPVTGGEGPTP